MCHVESGMNLFGINSLLHGGCNILSGYFITQFCLPGCRVTWSEGTGVHRYYFPHWHLHMKLTPRRIVLELFLASLSVSHPIFFFYLCCSQSLSWSGKSEVIGFWIKESKQGWKQALIHFTLSGRTGWQETLGNSGKRAFALNFPSNNQRHHLGPRCFY